MSAAPHPGPDPLLGPLLRRVDGPRATIWLEMSRPGEVEVRAGGGGGAARTFAAHGHHYAFVVVDGLPPAAATPYEVFFDGTRVWPPDQYRYPPPVIRTRSPDDPVRLVFGSCRESSPLHETRFPPDALDAYAVRLVTAVTEGGPGAAMRPDMVLLLGDQVYADETSGTMRRWLRHRRGRRHPDAPATQVVDFHEYTQLYLDSWTDPDVRWLLSTVPSAMIFDDHEIIDDWNASAAWREQMGRQPWWTERISAGLASYWVYQHLGNLSPDELAADPVYRAVVDSQDASRVLDEFGARADADRAGYRWSYSFDVGRTRVVVLDNRAGRQLEPGMRAMLPPATWDWLVAQADADCDHLVIGSSLPWLMPPAIHHVEAAGERLSESSRQPVAAVAEKLRQQLDLEHWAAFRRSFDSLGELLGRVASRPDGPTTITVLSGDVHHSYVARAKVPGPGRLYQLTCSPVHNQLPVAMRSAMRFGWSRAAERVGRGIARVAGLPRPSVGWGRLAGPVFGNAVGELVHDGRSARVSIHATTADKQLSRVIDLALT
jgi:hypothetical protein